MEDAAVLVRLQQFSILVDKMVGVEALIVDADLLHLLFVQVGFDVSLPVEYFVANGATSDLFEPPVDAIFVVDMETTKHSALTLIDYRLEADDAVTDHVFAIFHADQYLLYLCVGLRCEPLVDLILRACYHQVLLTLLIFSLLSLSLRISQRLRLAPLLLSLSVFSLNLPLVLRIVVVLIHDKLDAYEEDDAGYGGEDDGCYLGDKLPVNIATAFFCRSCVRLQKSCYQ